MNHSPNMNLKRFAALQWTCRLNKLLHFLHIRWFYVYAEYGDETGDFYGYRIGRGPP